MNQQYDKFFENAQNATDKGGFLKLPRYQQNLKYNFDGFYGYCTNIGHHDLPGKTMVKLGMWSPTSTTNYNCTRRFLEDHYGFQECMSN
jgi:hypothetical protein